MTKTQSKGEVAGTTKEKSENFSPEGGRRRKKTRKGKKRRYEERNN